MTSITKISATISVLFVVALVFGVFALNSAAENSVFAPNTVYALGSGGAGDGGGGGDAGGCGCGGGAGDPGGRPTPPPPPPPPPPSTSCDFFNGDPTTLPYGGGDVDLEWGTTNATDVSIDNGIGAVSSDGNKTVFVDADTTFTLTATGPGGTDTCTVPVKVEEPPVAKCDFLTANPTSLPNGGGNVTLEWETTNATDVSINNGVGTVAADGSTVVNVTGTITYVLTAVGTGNGNNDTCDVKITVDPPVDGPSCDSFTATPNHFNNGTGGNVTLTWATTDAGTVSINNGIGNVSADGSTTINVNQNTTFTLTATNAGGTVTCNAPVTVKSTNNISCAANVNFSIDKTSLPRGGGNVTLTWSTTDITSVAITSVNNPGLSGSATINVDSDETFILTAQGVGGPIQCPVSVDVDSGGGGGSPSPRCEFFVSDDDIEAGDTVTLRWETRNGRELTIWEGDEGDEKIFETDDDDDVDEGSIKVRPTKDTEYTLVVERGSKDRTCRVEVEVDEEEEIVIKEIRDQGLVAGISLTQVPYTGFDAGPTLTFIFYAVLAAWALFVAYMLVVKEDSVLGFSLAGAFPKRKVIADDMSTDESVDAPEVSEAAQYVASVATPAAPAFVPTNLPTAPAADATIGYAAAAGIEVDDTESTEMKELEDRAHDAKVLLSSDAMRHLIAMCPKTVNRVTFLDRVIAEAKVSYPSEDGWVVLNQARMQELCEKRMAHETVSTKVAVAEDKKVNVAEVRVPAGSGSLAEAIVSGNIAAAYQMIGDRPMVALADAAADLDALYRGRKGEEVVVSDMLATESAKLEISQITEAIDALTGAIDGTYTDEASAVKMAILKAVKSVA